MEMTPAPDHYRVVHAETIDRLVREVNERIEEGWHVQGGLACAAGVYYQAMVSSVLDFGDWGEYDDDDMEWDM